MVKLSARHGCTLLQLQVVRVGWAAPASRSLLSASLKTTNRSIDLLYSYSDHNAIPLSVIALRRTIWRITTTNFVFMPKYRDKIRLATLIARNKIVESHVTVILTVNGSSLPTFS